MINSRVARMILSILPIQHKRYPQTEIGPKSMYEHRAPNIRGMVDMKVDSFIGRECHKLKEGDDNELEGAGPTKDGSHGDEGCSSCKVRGHHAVL